MADGSTGERIAAYRRRRGLSQAALAGLVGRSESWLSQVERGVRSVDRLSVLLDMSRVLHVDVDSLVGRPWDLAPNGNSDGDDLAGIVDAHHRYQAAEYEAVLVDVPSLLSEVDATRYGQTAGDRTEVLLAYTY